MSPMGVFFEKEIDPGSYSGQNVTLQVPDMILSEIDVGLERQSTWR